MPLKLKLRTEKIHGGGFINKTMVVKMVDHYRSNRRKDKDSLKFAHFTVAEVIALFVANDIIADPFEDLSEDELAGIENYGVKIYMANHAGMTDSCPAGRETTYKDSDTVILCNTELDKKNKWVDMLDDDRNWISFAGTGISSLADDLGEPGEGLDKGSICPPDCPGAADSDGYYSSDSSTVNP